MLKTWLSNFSIILREHTDDFWTYYGILDTYDIGKFILDTISNEPVYGYFPGMDPGSRGLVYYVDSRYFRIIVAPDGYISTAFPPVSNKPFPDYIDAAGTGVIL